MSRERPRVTNGQDVPAVTDIIRVLQHLSQPNLKPPHESISSDPRSGNDRLDIKLPVKKGVSKTQRGRGMYDRYYVNIPISVVRLLGLKEGSFVEIRLSYGSTNHKSNGKANRKTRIPS